VAERKTKVLFNDQMVDGMEVPVEESTERWSEVKLEDGTIMRVKMIVISVVRINEQYDPQGNPMYLTNMAPTVAIVETPPQLRRKVQ
jgi:hypothetical protein